VVSGRLLRAVTLLAAGAYIGCGGGDDGLDRSRDAPASAVSATSSGDQVLDFPACESAFPPDRRILRPGWRRHSITVGPVRLLNARGMTRPGLARRNRRSVLKVRALIPPGRLLTIEIGRSARSALRFVKPGSQFSDSTPPEPYAVIRVENCPPIPPETQDLPAGNRYVLPLFVVVRRDSCVPLTITREQGRRYRRQISFGGGDCGA
jgi:hypothetical protein